MLPLCRAENIAVIPWSPLARGFLAGNRKSEGFGETVRAKTDEYAHGMYYQPSDFQVVDCVAQIATRRGVSNAQVALAWLLSKPGVTAPIVGASRMKPFTRPRSHVHVKSPDIAPVAAIGAEVSQAPTSAFSAAKSWARCSASRSIRKFIASTSPPAATEPAVNIFAAA